MRSQFNVALTCFLTLFFYLPVTAESAKNSQKKKFRILALGDSLTDGYGLEKDQAFPKKLQEKLHENGYEFVEVINAGISGSTTATAPSRLRWQLRSKPDLMILALGANDGLRGVPIETSKKNLSETIEMAKKENIKVLLAGMLLPPNYGEEYRNQFSDMYKELSKEKNISLIPFLLEGVAGEPSLNLEDAIHPNEKGHERIAKNVYKHLIPHLPAKNEASKNETRRKKPDKNLNHEP